MIFSLKYLFDLEVEGRLYGNSIQQSKDVMENIFFEKKQIIAQFSEFKKKMENQVNTFLGGLKSQMEEFKKGFLSMKKENKQILDNQNYLITKKNTRSRAKNKGKDN
jgi:hypothetical protein